VPVRGAITGADLGPDGEWLAFADEEGVKVSRRPFETVRALTQAPALWGSEVAFNRTGQLLAYSDAVGLQVLDLATDTSELMLAHEIASEADGEFPHFLHRIYQPEHWSYHNDTMIVRVRSWEDCRFVLLYLPERRVHDFTEMCSEIDWQAGAAEDVFAVSVSYSPITGRGEPDGLYVNTFDGVRLDEKRVYWEEMPVEPTLRSTRYGTWNHSGDWISFVQTVGAPGTADFESRLMMTRGDGAETQELWRAGGQIFWPTWTPDDKALLFVYDDVGGEARRLMRLQLDDGSVLAWDLPLEREPVRGIYLSRDGDWAVVGFERFYVGRGH
jgi:hypothetical protein